MSWSGLATFLIGFFLAIAFLVAGGAATAYYFFTKLTTPPPKPIFPEEQPIAKAKSSPATAKSKSGSAAKLTATPSKSEKPPTKLEPGAYKARVTWPDGLSIRSEPNLDSNRLGGIAYNEQIVVLEESPDKKWQKVRQENGDQQGWIKAGNIERVDDQKAERGNNTDKEQ